MNWTTLSISVFAAAKLFLQSAGVSIPDETWNQLINGVSAVVAIIGIMISHQKPPTPVPKVIPPAPIVGGGDPPSTV